MIDPNPFCLLKRRRHIFIKQLEQVEADIFLSQGKDLMLSSSSARSISMFEVGGF